LGSELSLDSAPLGAAVASLGSEPFVRRSTVASLGSEPFVRRSTGWIADAWRDVAVWRHEHGLRLEIADVGAFAVAAEGIAVIGPAATPVAADTLTEALLGAPLVLALALNDVWCLHASAVIASGRVVAFAGESGHGKSTLAAYLDGAPEGAWGRVADDSLPVCAGPAGVLALPHFPQLKLPAEAQYPVDAPASVPLAAVYVIAPPNGDESVSLRPLSQRQAMQALIRHTVAARAFDRPLLAAHLAFCERAAARIPVWRLAYSHRREALPEVREAIRRLLGEQQ